MARVSGIRFSTSTILFTHTGAGQYSSPLVNLEYDAVTKQFSLIDNDASDEEEVRHLVEKKIVNIGRHIVSESNNYLRAKSRMLDSESANQASPDSKKTYIARSCPCDDSERTYCLLDGISEGTSVPDSCGVPCSDKFFEASYNSSDSSPTSAYYNNLEIGCFELNSQTVFTRNAVSMQIRVLLCLDVMKMREKYPSCASDEYRRASTENFPIQLLTHVDECLLHN